MLTNAQFFRIVLLILGFFSWVGYMTRDPKSFTIVTISQQNKKDTTRKDYNRCPSLYEIGKMDSTKRMIVAIIPNH